ncbi:MAG: TIGR03905 family TSCPD domain-containing protein [Ruminococcaceae bacterium]|nr:TIGR03905 family TSCPD domain-containing protein [Oscillospiraceae bacterium]
MTKTYYPRGVCSRRMDIEVEDGVVKEVLISGGCSGNRQGIAALVKGRRVSEIISLLSGINCNGRGTSCPDQLARALVEIEREIQHEA